MVQESGLVKKTGGKTVDAEETTLTRNSCPGRKRSH